MAWILYADDEQVELENVGRLLVRLHDWNIWHMSLAHGVMAFWARVDRASVLDDPKRRAWLRRHIFALEQAEPPERLQ